MTRKRTLTLHKLLLTAILLLSGCSMAIGYAVQFAELPDLVVASDVIVIGSLTASKSGQHDYMLSVHVQQILKGKANTRDIQIFTVPSNYRSVSLPNALIFLSAHGTHWSLYPLDAEPFQDLGPSIPPAIPANLPPLYAVLQVLTNATETDLSPRARGAIFERMSEVETVLPPFNHPGSETNLRLSNANALLAFARQSIVPAMRRLDHSSDFSIVVNAYLIQAIFQDSSVLPQLRVILEHPDTRQNSIGTVQASEALARYYLPSTAAFMLGALNSTSEDVRKAAALSLSQSIGPTAIPVLIEQLVNKKNSSNMWFAECLYYACGQMKPDIRPLQTFVDYWTAWEKSHPGEVRRDRLAIKAILSKAGQPSNS